MREIIKQVIFEQRESSPREARILREIPQSLISAPEILVISGIRRCGKSTLLNQIRDSRPERDFYLNFDDERLLNFKVEHFQLLHEVFIELFGDQKTFYFDEIQNVPGWERFVRRLADSGAKVVVTGSNATMLSRELGTHLTGRFVRYELFPFSFGEFLKLRGSFPEEKDFYTTKGKAGIAAELSAYFRLGGFPQYIRSGNDDYLKTLYESIVYRDVLVRNGFSGERELLEMAYFLASNSAKRFSYTSLAKTVGLKHSETVKKYIDALENSYLIFQLRKFDYSLKKQLVNTKKVYFADTAMVQKIGFNPTPNLGPLMETLVFTELKRRGADLFYHAGNRECDFVLRKGTKIVEAIQVTAGMLSPETREREFAGLLDALSAYNLDTGTIVSLDEEAETEIDGHRIFVRPLWKWLLERE